MDLIVNYIHKLKKYYHLLLFIAILLVPIDAGNTAEYQLVMKSLDNNSPDYTVGRDSKCSLHSLEMNRTEVDISYGKPNESKEREMKIVGTNFPNGRNYISGGCVVWSGMDVKAIIYLCTSCVEVRNKWLEKNSMEQIWFDRVKRILVDLNQ
ncbi:uncharacterized protein METZ01_LOCUS291160 [marine metagenome]|uniref:Uncharacterized protein n=1 Tax=marine metagenome TaxID=408172 RepID=A0A382LP30_9ZZZZ